jgi:hypothetical protein
MDVEQLVDEIQDIYSQWWCDMFPCGCIKDTKNGSDGLS